MPCGDARRAGRVGVSAGGTVRAGRLLTALLAASGLAAAGLAAGCGEHEYERPDAEERVAAADTLFSPAAFDTLTWASDSARLLRGNEVYASECRRCHGYLGSGDTEYARAHDIYVPSLVKPDWEYARDLRATLHEIFVGHGEGMPSWGLGRLTPREIQAAAYYVLYQLRPDVLSDTAAAGG